jgi:branched-chain amino acid transport system permease protein
MLVQLLANGFIAGCGVGLLALSLALIYRTTRILHIAHGATYTLAAYCVYWLAGIVGWPLGWAIAAALLLAAILGVAYELLIYQPLARRGASSLVALLASLGLYLALVNLVALLFGNQPQVLRIGSDQNFVLGLLLFTRAQLVQLAACLCLIGAVLFWLIRSQAGHFILSTADNPALAAGIGIDPRLVRVTVFALGSSLAAAAAILSSYDTGLDPQMGMPALLLCIVAMITGGVKTFAGGLAGAQLLMLMQSFVVWKTSGRWTEAIAFVLLLAVLLFRPQGLFVAARRLEEQE